MPFDYYYHKQHVNIALLDTEVRALPFATPRGYGGSEWVHQSLTPEPGKPLVLHWEVELTAPEADEVEDVVTDHDGNQKTQDQIDQAVARRPRRPPKLARIQELGAAARAVPPTITPAEETELLGLLERRLYG